MSAGRHELRPAVPQSTADPEHPMWRPVPPPRWGVLAAVGVVYLILSAVLGVLVFSRPPSVAEPRTVPVACLRLSGVPGVRLGC